MKSSSEFTRAITGVPRPDACSRHVCTYSYMYRSLNTNVCVSLARTLDFVQLPAPPKYAHAPATALQRIVGHRARVAVLLHARSHLDEPAAFVGQ